MLTRRRDWKKILLRNEKTNEVIGEIHTIRMVFGKFEAIVELNAAGEEHFAAELAQFPSNYILPPEKEQS